MTSQKTDTKAALLAAIDEIGCDWESCPKCAEIRQRISALLDAALQEAREEQRQQIKNQSEMIREMRRDSARMLRRGMRAIERQEWEPGETCQEWYHAASTLAGSYELAAKIEDEQTAILRGEGE